MATDEPQDAEDLLADARRKLRIKRRELAVFMGVSKAEYLEWERGEKPMSPEARQKLAELLRKRGWVRRQLHEQKVRKRGVRLRSILKEESSRVVETPDGNVLAGSVFLFMLGFYPDLPPLLANTSLLFAGLGVSWLLRRLIPRCPECRQGIVRRHDRCPECGVRIRR